MNDVYITSIGVFLPNEPISNDDMENYLGRVNGQPSRLKDRILKQNGILQRFYSLTKDQQSTHTNAELAALAIKQAIQRSRLDLQDIQLIATGTSQADLPVPGFASMVHGELDISTCEVASFQSVCASAIMAIKNAYAQVKCSDKENAVCVGSEFVSRLFKASRYESQNLDQLSFDTEFLRWMLSDGAGAVILENQPNPSGISLKIEWVDLRSNASEYPVCMYAGTTTNKDDQADTWLDYPDYESASKAGALNLKQDIRLLDHIIELGVDHYFDLIKKDAIQVDDIDWLCCHYSSEFFKKPIQERMINRGGEVAEEKWFNNLTTKGNTGAASIFIMLEELMYSGKLKNGDTILCMVPESGRFITSFMKLRVVIN